jgi:hypothetical protein
MFEAGGQASDDALDRIHRHSAARRGTSVAEIRSAWSRYASRKTQRIARAEGDAARERRRKELTMRIADILELHAEGKTARAPSDAEPGAAADAPQVARA